VRLTSNLWLRTRETLGHTYSTDANEATLGSSYPQNLKCPCRITSVSHARRMPQSGFPDPAFMTEAEARWQIIQSVAIGPPRPGFYDRG
jgi:hypothetical protein